MSAHDSQYPGEAKSKSIRFDPTGFSMNWRNGTILIGTVLSLLGAGGAYGGFRLVSEAQVDEKVAASKADVKKEIEVVAKAEKEDRVAIVGLTVTIGAVQTIQHRDIAHREARRVVEEQIQCRRTDNGCQDRKDDTRERIRRANMKRLAAKPPQDPCTSLQCN